MTKHILFIQGGGSEEDYLADLKLVNSLKTELDTSYEIHYPVLPNESTPDFGRAKQIANEIALIKTDLILVGHSLGASMLVKYLSENKIPENIIGVFLLSTPYWSGDEDWKQAFKLRDDFGERIPQSIPIFLYHCVDDEEVPVNHIDTYSRHLSQATIRRIPTGGHQLNNDLSMIAKDIKSLHHSAVTKTSSD